jgi:hypothetical protein
LNLALQGVDVEPRDIDIVTDKTGALKIGQLLKEFVIEEVKYKEGEKIASYFGKLEINGVQVDIIGEPKMRKNESEDWKKKSDLSKEIIILDLGEFKIPAMSLDSELEAYKTLGRIEKVQKIEEVLRKKGRD